MIRALLRNQVYPQFSIKILLIKLLTAKNFCRNLIFVIVIGTHQELLAKPDGTYKKLVSAQQFHELEEKPRRKYTRQSSTGDEHSYTKRFSRQNA